MEEKTLQIPVITPSDLREMLEILDKMPNPPALMVYGAPGIGKTSILLQFAQDKNYEMRVKHLSRMDATDWSGVPKQSAQQEFTEFLPISIFKRSAKRIVLFFDELNTAMPQVLNAALDVILEKKGEGENAILPKNTIILAAGNLGEEDGTYVEPLSAAVKTRMIQVRMEQNTGDWLDWAKKQKEPEFSPAVIRFIQTNEKYLLNLDDFRKNLDQMPTPRGWEQVSNLVQLIPKSREKLLRQMITGVVGEEAAEAFLEFYKNPDIAEDEWRQQITIAEKFYSNNTADCTSQKLEMLTLLVNTGLKCLYSDGNTRARKYADFMRNNKQYKAALSALSTLDLQALETYLQNKGYSDVVDMLRAAR